MRMTQALAGNVLSQLAGEIGALHLQPASEQPPMPRAACAPAKPQSRPLPLRTTIAPDEQASGRSRYEFRVLELPQFRNDLTSCQLHEQDACTDPARQARSGSSCSLERDGVDAGGGVDNSRSRLQNGVVEKTGRRTACKPDSTEVGPTS